MTNDLAALIEATANPDRWAAWAAERRLECALAAAYRSGDLVLIDREGLRERVARALAEERPWWGEASEWTSPTDRRLADAAIAAILGEG